MRPPRSITGDPDDAPAPAERLMRCGLEEGAAWRQALWSVADPEHRKHCEICRAGTFAPEEAAPSAVGPLESTDAFE